MVVAQDSVEAVVVPGWEGEVLAAVEALEEQDAEGVVVVAAVAVAAVAVVAEAAVMPDWAFEAVEALMEY